MEGISTLLKESRPVINELMTIISKKNITMPNANFVDVFLKTTAIFALIKSSSLIFVLMS